MTEAFACSPPHPGGSRLRVWPTQLNLFYTMLRRMAAVLMFAAGLTLFVYSTAEAQEIVVDGSLTDSSWLSLGTSAGGPATSNPGNEINALYGSLDDTYFYIGVAGTVTLGNRIIVFIDSKPGGYATANFGRASAPPGINNFNSAITFDSGFLPDYVLVIGVDISNNYTWDLYTLSGTVGTGGGPDLFLGNQTDAAGDLRALPASGSTTTGFETRLTYSNTGTGVDITVSQVDVKLFAADISDGGVLSNQFITRADSSQTGPYGSGVVNFISAAPNPVTFSTLNPLFFISSGIVINEFSYIQPSPVNDKAEFVEIKNVTGSPVNLDDYKLRFVNSSASVYREIDLPNYSLSAGGYYVVCGNNANVPNCNQVITPAENFIENGIPGAIALVYSPSNTIVDTVSYGGDVTGYTEGNGASTNNIGAVEGLGESRYPDGNDLNNNSVDFQPRCITPGAFNTNQTSGCPSVLTPTPTGSPTPTWTPSITPTPLPTLPGGCQNIVINSDFELDGSWIFGDDPVPGKFTSLEKHGGLRGVQLGGPNDDDVGGWGMDKVSYSSVRQQVNIPGNASIAQLRWWHFYHTEEAVDPGPSAMSDRQEVILLNPNGKTLKILKRVRENEGGWAESLVDLTDFRGKSVYLYFNVFNDASGSRTWMYLDDVTLDVCYPPTPVPSDTPLPTTTPTPTFAPTATETPTETPTVTETPTPTDTPTADELAFVQQVVAWYTLYVPAYTGLSAQVADAIANPVMDQDEWISTTTGYIADLRLLIGQARLIVAPARFTSDWATVLAAIDDLEAALDNLETAMGTADSSPLTAVSLALDSANTTIATIIEAMAPLAPSESVAPVSVAVAVAPTASTNAVEGLRTAPLLALSSSSTIPGICDCSADTLACEDYATQGEAQSCHDYCVAQVGLDVHKLDLDGDQIACEALPPMSGNEVSAAGGIAPVRASPAPTSGTPEPSSIQPCIELLTNGNFETDDTGWTLTTGAGAPVYATEQTFNGSRQALRLGITGGANTASISAADQELTLPPNAYSIVLSFRYYTLYDQEPGPGDLQYVDLYNAVTGQFAGRALGAQLNDRTWMTLDYDLTPLAGQRISLVFAVNNDGVDGRTAMYVDNVSVKACNFVELTTPTPGGPASTPTSTPDVARSIRTPVPPSDVALASTEPTAALIAPPWLTRVGAIGVLAGVLGAIGFVTLMIVGAIRRED